MQNLHDFKRKPAHFLRDASGNFAIIFAFAALPLMLLIGIGIDYFHDLSLKARLEEAADAAALAAANTATAFVKNNSATESGTQLTNDAIAAGVAQGLRAFTANIGVAATEMTAFTPVISVTPTTIVNGNEKTNGFQSSVQYASQFNTAFGPLVGVNQFPLAGVSKATAAFPAYMDLYFLIDASGSMGIGATDADQAAMLASPANCTVACHSPWQDWRNGNVLLPQGTYPAVRAIQPAVTLRIDVVRQAVINELKVLRDSPNTFPGQFRVAIYEFSNGLQKVFDLSSNLDGAIAAAANIDVIGAAGQGGTYATFSLGQLAQTLPSPGDGSSSTSRLGSVLLFTDGIQNDSSPTANGGEIDACSFASNFTPYSPTSACEWKIQGFNSADCGPIKSQGYTMYTLDFIYYTTPATVATDARYAFIANTLNPSVQRNMADCATSAANAVYAMTPADFDNALAALISQVLANVHLTQ